MSELEEKAKENEVALDKLRRDRDRWHENGVVLERQIEALDATVSTQEIAAKALRKAAKKAAKALETNRLRLARARADRNALQQAEDAVSDALCENYIPF